MVARLLLLVWLGGCDGVLHLERIPDQPRDAAVGGDGDGAGMTDASKPPACTPPVFTTSPTIGASGVSAQGIVQNMDVGYVIAAGSMVEYVQPILSSTPNVTTIGGSAYAYLAVQPTLGMGAKLFFYNGTTGKVYETKNLGTLTDWSTATESIGLPVGGGPGAPAELPGGELRMMVAVGAALDEYDRMVGGDWQLLSSSVTNTDLGGTTGILSYPALTPTGLGLVFDYAGDPAVQDGIYFMHRDTLDARFTSPVRIYDLVYTSPVLTADCRALYAVDDNMHLVLISP